MVRVIIQLVYRFSDFLIDEIIEKQILNLKGKLPTVVALTQLPHSSGMVCYL